VKKDGDELYFDDGRTVYNIDDVRKLLNVSELTPAERQYLNSFSRFMYDRYKTIRDCCNPRKCKKISVLQVRERLEQEEYKALTIRLLNLNPDQIDYILDFVSIYFQKLI